MKHCSNLRAEIRSPASVRVLFQKRATTSEVLLKPSRDFGNGCGVDVKWRSRIFQAYLIPISWRSAFRFRVVPLGWRETFSEFKRHPILQQAPSLTWSVKFNSKQQQKRFTFSVYRLWSLWFGWRFALRGFFFFLPLPSKKLCKVSSWLLLMPLGFVS